MNNKTTSVGKKTRGDGAQKVYVALREDILSMALEPGHVMDEVSLANRFGVSRSPIREALVRLSAESLLTTLPNKSNIVAPLSVETFPQYIDALDLVQRAVTRLAAQLRSEADLVQIEARQMEFAQAVACGDVLGMIERNRAFHVAIAAAARNRYLCRSYEQLLDEGRRFLRLYFRSYNDSLPAELVSAHVAFIDAIRAQDVVTAERIARTHTAELHDQFTRYMSTRYTQDIVI